MTERLARAWFFLGAVLLVLSPFSEIGHSWHRLTNRFFALQDLPVLACLMIAAFGLRSSPRLREKLAAGWRRLTGDRAPAIPRRTWRAVLMLAAACVLIAWAGCWLVLDNYPLSMDEFMADFGARILEHGELAAPVPPPWRLFANALTPIFAFIGPGGAWWTPSYLPVNAALRALGETAGAASLVNPLLAGVSVIAVWGVARRLWPERQDLALAAAILLATSSQFLLNAMSAYAMTAHLALNLVWLWLFLRGGRLGHAGAMAVGFLACGVHQLVFHPLFAAPFIAQLWLERRWRLGALYMLAYAAMGLFWVDLWRLAAAGAVQTMGPAHPTNGAVGAFAQLVLTLVTANDPGAVGLMAKNLIRFATWQNPLVAPLIVVGAVGAWREKGPVRSLLLGLVLATAAMGVVIAYQGHGWGYRYLHGFLGSACLLAARAWGALTAQRPEGERPAARRAFVTMAAAAMLILLPVRAIQAHLFVTPYASAHAAIAHTPAQVVLVDETDAWFTVDLVRNDPFLTSRPLVMRLNSISPDRLRGLCASHSLALFGRAQAERFGIWTVRVRDLDGDLRRAILAGARCGGRPVIQVAAPA